MKDKNYSLIKAIRSEKDYKSNIERRDKNSRKYIAENYSIDKNKSKILPGQLISFDYFEPATKDQLEYYDAMPVTIFFGVFNSSKGPRVLGFNVHYYPPKIRFMVMDTIFSIFKSIYLKSWDKPLTKEISGFNYQTLIDQLKKAKLEFGVREYDPKLMRNVIPIPTEGWSKAVLTEGRFKKQTREQILHYWKNKVSKILS